MKLGLTEGIPFGYGGQTYLAEPTAYDEYLAAVLPDGRTVSLEQFVTEFPASGELRYQPQPTRVEIGIHTPDRCAKSIKNETGKNVLIQRLPFNYAGKLFKVSPEVYGNCLVWGEEGLELRSTLIRLPSPMATTFLDVTVWSQRNKPLQILETSSTQDIYLLDSDGNPILEETKGGKKKPVLRPHVWATGPFDTCRFSWEDRDYVANFMARPKSFGIVDGKFVSVGAWKDGMPTELSLTNSPDYSVTAVPV